jgi:limonene-1,2-epoxide hydrolase
LERNYVKTTRGLATVTAIALLALTACGGQKAPPAITEGVPDDVVNQFLAAMDEFNPEAVRGLLSPNAKLMPPNVASVSGADNIIEYFKGGLADELDYEFTREAAGMSSGLAVAEGTYKVRNKTSDAYIEQGKWMAVFAKIDGAWKVARLMTNTDAPVAAPVVGVEEGKE